jgi:multiple sugar transport system permease protein
MALQKLRLEKSLTEVSRSIVLTAGLIAVLFPLLWLLKTSFIENKETLVNPIYWLPQSFTLDNYLHPLMGRFESIDGQVNINKSPAWPSVSFFVGLVINGLIVSGSVTLLSIVLAILTGYGFSRFRFFGRKSLMVLVLNTQMFPYIAIVIPLYVMYRNLGMLNTYTGLIIAMTGMVLPFSIWMIKSFCDTIDEDLEDAAYIDGASRVRILWSIVVPVITPGIASVAMFAFLNSWNHLLYVMILNTREELLTVPMGLFREYASSYFYYYATMSAGLLVIIIPIAFVYIPFQKYFASGLTAGAVKG